MLVKLQRWHDALLFVLGVLCGSSVHILDKLGAKNPGRELVPLPLGGGRVRHLVI